MQYYALLAEDFLLTFFEAWHADVLHTLSLFRDTSELFMDQQLYLGPDCLTRLSEESSILSPNLVDVMPSREGFDIGIAVSGDLKVRNFSSVGFLHHIPTCILLWATKSGCFPQPPSGLLNFLLPLPYPLICTIPILTRTITSLFISYPMAHHLFHTDNVRAPVQFFDGVHPPQ